MRVGRRGAHRGAGALTVAAMLAAAVMLSGCSAELDPAEARDSLSVVNEDPAPPKADEIFDAELHPEPLVEARDCSAVLVIKVRGTGEPMKGQLLSPVARSIVKSPVEDVATLDLDYPADTDVKEGGTEGVRLLIDTINVQSDACPKEKFVLLGYSQGAMVVGDALAAAEQRMIGATAGAITEDAAKQIRAVVMYGDPRFNGEEPFNEGTFDPELGGIMPRPLGALDDYADRIIDFCVKGDLVCQATLDVAQSEKAADKAQKHHTDYYSNGMQKDGSDFVIDLLNPRVKLTR
ncbi:cutinase family protein [Leucobacter insecticola]|uniref:Cutinase family protein n=1 Tax=Leucobacter insecticola TaxID=2714934 RepID=A0A6G8FJE6_9MICO|nr:cutinase family protein [Leucobacter insecticola]QIM16497.1 cutinase family protein [Leucobacter insecticola]